MAKQSNRRKFGTLGRAIPATRVLSKPMPHFIENGIDAHSLIVINEEEGTFMGVNVYGDQDVVDGASVDGHLGKGFDPATITYPLPASDSPKWKQWGKKGYREVDVSTFDVLEDVRVEEEVTA